MEVNELITHWIIVRPFETRSKFMTEWITKTKGLCYNVWKIIESEMPKLYQHLAYASERGQSYSVEINSYFAIFRHTLLPSMENSISVLLQRLLSVWILNNSRKEFIFFLSIHLSFSISFFFLFYSWLFYSVYNTLVC